MSIKIFIKRKSPSGDGAELNHLLQKLRSLTLEQTGYVSGETLTRIDEPGEVIVVSTWNSVENWNKWVNDPRRIHIQTEVDKLTGVSTEYSMYTT